MADSLWSQARDALAAVAEASPQHDTDGVDLYFLNNTQIYQKNIKVRYLKFLDKEILKLVL